LSTDNTDNEWKRVSGNPQNMIVSDSLRDLIAIDDYEGTPLQLPTITALLEYPDLSLDLEVVLFSRAKNSFEVSLLCTREDAYRAMMRDDLLRVTVSSNSNDESRVFTVDENLGYSVSYEFGSSQLNNTLVSEVMCLCRVIINV